MKSCKHGHTGERNKRGDCIECVKIHKKTYYLKHRESIFEAQKKEHRENPEKRRAYMRRYSLENREKKLARRRVLYQSNPERRKESSRKWRERNPGKFKALCAKQRAKKKNAIPKWADLNAIRKIYKNCPEGHHVDHIIPLRGKTVSGLHVETNLQYLTAFENHFKGNKFKQEYI